MLLDLHNQKHMQKPYFQIKDMKEQSLILFCTSLKIWRFKYLLNDRN